ncbi:hypothetical protein D3C72_1429410 [compost metagenome]
MLCIEAYLLAAFVIIAFYFIQYFAHHIFYLNRYGSFSIQVQLYRGVAICRVRVNSVQIIIGSLQLCFCDSLKVRCSSHFGRLDILLAVGSAIAEGNA